MQKTRDPLPMQQAPIYEHIKTGRQYRIVLRSFDVMTQRPHIVYMSLVDGAMFNRDAEDFATKFKLASFIEITPMIKAA